MNLLRSLTFVLFRAFLKPSIDFAVGGQAVMEGVMMRSPRYYVVAVRDPEGDIQTQQSAFSSWTARWRILNLPIVRGMVHLVESMMIGSRSLQYSNDIFMGEEVKNQGRLSRLLWGLFSVISMLVAVTVMLFMMKVLPFWVATQCAKVWPSLESNYLLFNAVDGVVKITLFLSYLLVLALSKDIRRVFQYHGAEHKSIWTYEKGLPLTVEHARAQTRFHPRCGTSFIFIVILMSVVVYTLVPPAPTFALSLLERIAVIPLIAGLSYELLKLSARFQERTWVRLLVAPGLFIQRLTTREPDDAQLEVALHSLKSSLKAEELPVS